MTTLATTITDNTRQDGTSLANSEHDVHHNTIALDHNHFFANGPSLTAVQVATPQATAANRLNILEGSNASPITGSASSALITRNVLLSAADYGGLNVQIHSQAPSTFQASGIQTYIEQYASADALAFGDQVIMNNVAGSGFGYFCNVSNVAKACTISHASPAVVTFNGHGCGANQEVQFASRVNIFAITVSSPCLIATTVDHGLTTGDIVTIEGTSGTSAALNATWTVTVITSTTFQIPVAESTGAGTAGSVSSKTLPAGVTQGTRYFVRALGLTANAFTLCTNPADPVGSVVNTTSDGLGTFYLQGGSLWGLNPLVINSSQVPMVYNESGSCTMSAILIQAAGGGPPSGNAMRVFDTGTLLSEGIIFDPRTIQNQSIYDLSSSVTAYKLAGTHTDGIDFSAGTFTDNQLKLNGATAYTPTVTSTGGAFTTVSATGRYLKLGKWIQVEAAITVTTIGGAAGGVLEFSLPSGIAAKTGFFYMGVGRNINTGLMLQLVTQSGGNLVSLVTYANAFPVNANGDIIVCSGFIEID